MSHCLCSAGQEQKDWYPRDELQRVETQGRRDTDEATHLHNSQLAHKSKLIQQYTTIQYDIIYYSHHRCRLGNNYILHKCILKLSSPLIIHLLINFTLHGKQ